jgi:uncharacterized Zn-finger protein
MERVQEKYGPPTVVISGMASGIDSAGERWAKRHKIELMEVPVHRAEWIIHGSRAGMLRNERMADLAEGLAAIWDGISRGTRDMMDRMTQLRKPIEMENLKDPIAQRDSRLSCPYCGEPGARPNMEIHLLKCSAPSRPNGGALIFDIPDELLIRGAHGDTLCPVCQRPYRDHPMDKFHVSWDCEPFLHKLCTGEWAKL